MRQTKKTILILALVSALFVSSLLLLSRYDFRNHSEIKNVTFNIAGQKSNTDLKMSYTYSLGTKYRIFSFTIPAIPSHDITITNMSGQNLTDCTFTINNRYSIELNKLPAVRHSSGIQQKNNASIFVDQGSFSIRDNGDRTDFWHFSDGRGNHLNPMTTLQSMQLRCLEMEFSWNITYNTASDG